MGKFKVYKQTESLKNEQKPFYYSEHYLKSQNHPQLVCFQSDLFFLPVTIEGSVATSIARSPFGSFSFRGTPTLEDFQAFVEKVTHHLSSQNLTELRLRHPSSIYDHFIDKRWLERAGFTVLYEDINQHINLTEDWESGIHTMQKRKLQSLEQEGFEFGQMAVSELKVAHQFLEVCRAAQGLEINISFELLEKLAASKRYRIFNVTREDKISALCIAVEPTDKVAYYYLPATSPLFRSHSPMVLLISGMVEYYRSNAFTHLDLGVSSFEGKPQETLRLFKNRMGASEDAISTWSKQF